jgi:hypothetical protein
MLRGLGESGQLLLEGLLRGAVAEATPGRGVERRHEPGKLTRGQRGGVALARQEAADPAVGVLDRAFRPGAVRVAEPSLRPKAVLEQTLGGELGAAVEGDAPAAALGQLL